MGESKVEKGKIKANDEAYRYYLPLFQLKEQNGTNMHTLTLLNTLPEGIDPSPVAEKQRQINRSKGELGIKNGWIVWQHKDYASNYNAKKLGEMMAIEYFSITVT